VHLTRLEATKRDREPRVLEPLGHRRKIGRHVEALRDFRLTVAHAFHAPDGTVRRVAAPATTVRSPLPLVGLLAGAGVLGALVAGRSPAIAGAAAVGLTGIAIAITRPQLGLLLLVAAGTLEAFIPQVLGPQLTAVKLAGALCFATFFIDAALTRRKLRLDRSHAVLGLLLALAFVSSLGARSPQDALPVTIRYASFVGLYIVATQFDDERTPVRIAWVVSIAATIASAWGVQNFLTGVRPLAAPTYGDSNDLAFLVATALPLTLWLFRRPGWTRVLVPVMVGVSSLGVVLSLSRGALLALAVGVTWHAATERRHIPALLIVAVIAGAIGLVASQQAQERIDSSLQQKRNIAQENVETRLDAWRAAAELAAERPLTGVGPGNFGLYYFERTGRPPGTFGLRVVHDAYLDVAAELGILGMVLFVGFLVIVFMRASVAVRAGRGPPGLAAATRTALLVAMVGALTLSEQYYPPFWVLGALATMLWHSAPHAGRATRSAARAAPVPAA
jgi:putative inorganic carbon (HCO3(-)) transporter